MQIAILGESHGDCCTVSVLLRRLMHGRLPNPRIVKKGFDGQGDLLRKGAREIRRLLAAGTDRFVICADADRPDPSPVRDRIQTEVVERCGVADYAIVIPVYMIEAWILADVAAVRNVIKSFSAKEYKSPELIPDPKAELRRLHEKSGCKPRYIPELHNEKVAEHLSLAAIRSKCPSFGPLALFAG